MLVRQLDLDTIHARRVTVFRGLPCWQSVLLSFFDYGRHRNTACHGISDLVLYCTLSRYLFLDWQTLVQLAIAATRYVGGVKTQVKGYDNLLVAAEGNRVIICSKHQSTFETFFFPSVMTNPVAYVYKKELRWVPFSVGPLVVCTWSRLIEVLRAMRGSVWPRLVRS